MSKPSSSLIAPWHPTRLAPAIATALIGLALTGTHALAQGPGAAFGTCATQQCPNGYLVMTVALCWVVACVAFVGWFSLRTPGPRQARLLVQVCVLLAAFAAAGAAAWVAVVPPTLIGSAFGVPGDASQTIRVQ